MPELPEVETVARGLEQALIGDKFTKITLRRADLRFPFAPNFCEQLSHKNIRTISRRAKYLLLTLEDGTVLIGHLGMSGSFRIEPNGGDALDKHDHIIFETQKGVRVRYHDPRRFGFMLLTHESKLSMHPQIASIGPEPLGNEFNGPALSKALDGRKGPIKVAVLDQKVVAGVGNIYACEALYRARISPKRVASTIKGTRAERLATTIKEVLLEAIQSGGSTLRNYSNTDGELGYFQHRFRVYGHEGEECKAPDCTKTLKRITQAGRSTFYCSNCQR